MKQNKSLKRLMLASAIAIYMIASITMGDVHVRGYDRNDGTYVQPHWRSDPDGDFSNNWSTYPNINPHTKEIGTKRYPSHYSVESFYETEGAYSKDNNIADTLSSTVDFLFLFVLFYLLLGTKSKDTSPSPNINK